MGGMGAAGGSNAFVRGKASRQLKPIFYRLPFPEQFQAAYLPCLDAIATIILHHT